MPAFSKPPIGGDLRRELGEYIRELRLRRELTQAELAKAVGMTYYTAVSAIEVGRNTVPPERYEAFAKVLGVNPKTFAKNVLRMTNPWLFEMLYPETPNAT